MFQNISVSELKNLVNINIIDIRSVEKYNNGYIMNAINIPSDRLLINTDKYLDRNKKYYIYCQKGIQSRKICSILSVKRYNVVNVLGGYEAWVMNE